MAVQDAYIEALDNCIDRLAAGEAMESILKDYPELANELRPMLEAGSLFSRIRIPAAEVSLAQSRLAPKIQAAVQSGTGTIGYWMMVLVITFLAAGAVFTLQNQSNMPPVMAESSPEATEQIVGGGSMGNAEATEQIVGNGSMGNAESSPEATIAVTPLFTNISPTEAIVQSSPEATEQIVGGGSMGNAESTEQIVGGGSMGAAETTPEASETTPALITIEGPVETINVNVITIFDMEIVIPAGNPMLNVIRFGDVLRIEGEYQGDVFVAIVIVFVNVDVAAQDDVVWRDSGDCSNPPPPWAPANGWRRRCEGGGGNGNGRGNGRGGSS